MDGLNTFVTTLVIVLFPGIIWAKFDARFTRQKKPSDFSFVLNAIMYSVISYIISYFIYYYFLTPKYGITFDLLTVNGSQNGPIVPQKIVDDIITATAVSIFCAIIWLYGETYKIISYMLQFIRSTYRYGDEDVWDFVLSSSSKKTTFVNVRDYENGYLYTGYVINFSESGGERELLLNEVVVYDEETGAEIYDTPLLYVSRKSSGMTIEFPAVDSDLKSNKEEPCQTNQGPLSLQETTE